MRIALSLITFCLIVSAVFAAPPDEPQPRKRELEAKRNRLNTEIRNASALLNRAAADRKNTAAEYALIQKQVRMREEAVVVIRSSITENEERTAHAELMIISLEQEMVRLQAEQGTMMRAAYRYYRSNSSLMFLFASNGFNDAYRRWQYLRKYNEYSKRQVEVAVETKKSLEEQKAELAGAREQKTQLLAEEQQHTTALASEAANKDKMVKELSRKEVELRADVDKLQSQRENLNTMIENAIRNTIKVEKAAATASARTETVMPKLSTVEKTLDANFSKNRGRLAAPIENGVIVDRFGTHPHPAMPSLRITNNGITYRTQPNASVKAVFEGRVNSVNFVNGNDYCVLIEHGGYYTAYSQLSSASVKKGDKVTARQTLGQTNRNGGFHFEVWHGTQKLNPEVWIN
jgi:septal ring factor EnvC (AmiA/AmiB activator)